MSVAFNCPYCSAKIHIPKDHFGDYYNCPECSRQLQVPSLGIEPDSEFGPYTIEKRLGSGGMGEVFLATQRVMGRKVALKILSPEISANKQQVQRFIQEIRLTSKMEHPNIVLAFDAGIQNNHFYMAMSYVKGMDLEEILLTKGAFEEEEVLAICLKVAEALDYAWENYQILHRDIKPSNIMINRKGQVKLMDMGIAKTISDDCNLTKDGNLVGTPYYMSPEQAEPNANIDQRADIYSLGASLYHILTGKRPFEADNTMAVLVKHLSEELTEPKALVPELSDATNELICRMLAKTPEERPDSWHDLLIELNAIVDADSQVELASKTSVNISHPELEEETVDHKKEKSQPADSKDDIKPKPSTARSRPGIDEKEKERDRSWVIPLLLVILIFAISATIIIGVKNQLHQHFATAESLYDSGKYREAAELAENQMSELDMITDKEEWQEKAMILGKSNIAWLFNNKSDEQKLTHEIQKGDTIYSLAKELHLEQSFLLKLNKGEGNILAGNFFYIYRGDWSIKLYPAEQYLILMDGNKLFKVYHLSSNKGLNPGNYIIESKAATESSTSINFKNDSGTFSIRSDSSDSDNDSPECILAEESLLELFSIISRSCELSIVAD